MGLILNVWVVLLNLHSSNKRRVIHCFLREEANCMQLPLITGLGAFHSMRMDISGDLLRVLGVLYSMKWERMKVCWGVSKIRDLFRDRIRSTLFAKREECVLTTAESSAQEISWIATDAMEENIEWDISIWSMHEKELWGVWVKGAVLSCSKGFLPADFYRVLRYKCTQRCDMSRCRMLLFRCRMGKKKTWVPI